MHRNNAKFEWNSSLEQLSWSWVHWKNKTYKLRGRTFDFLGGYGWFQKKNILQTDFEEKKFLQGGTWPKKKSYTAKIYLSWSIMLEKILHRCMSGKKFYLKRFRKKKILTQIKSPIPLLKKSNGRPLNR